MNILGALISAYGICPAQFIIALEKVDMNETQYVTREELSTQTKLAKVIGTLSVHVTLARASIGISFLAVSLMVGAFWNLRASIDDLGDRLGSDIASMKIDIAELKVAVSDLRSLKTDVAALKTDVASLQRGQEQIFAILREDYRTQ